MGKFYCYSLGLDSNYFGLILFNHPLLHKNIANSDKEMWGRFKIEEIEEKELNFLMTKHLSAITEKISEASGIEFPKNFLIFPSLTKDIDIEFAKNESNFLIEFLNLINSTGFDFKSIYIYPNHPNQYLKAVQKTAFELRKLTERNNNFDAATKESIIGICSSYFSECEIVDNEASIFPHVIQNGEEAFLPSFALIKFIAYFRSFLGSLKSIVPLITAFNVEKDFMPYLIEAFTLEYIPSFSKNHNVSERLGDAVLDVVVSTTMISALMGKKNYFLNQQIRLAVSNKLFGIIGDQYKFSDCFIGPWDIEKLPGDCFESVVGGLYTVYGYERVCDFWRNVLFSIPLEVAQKMDVLKAIEAMKVSVDSGSVDLTPNPNPPDYIKNVIGNLIPPPVDKEGELHIKTKIIGAALIKLSIVHTVLSNLKCEKDAIIIQECCSKESINKVAEKMGIRNSMFLRVLVGGIMLQNGFEKTIGFVQTKIAPLFEIEKEMNAIKHHKHHHRE